MIFRDTQINSSREQTATTIKTDLWATGPKPWEQYLPHLTNPILTYNLSLRPQSLLLTHLTDASIEMAQPRAKPIEPGELDTHPGYARRNEVVRRADYLIQNYLEVPPHIQAGYNIITSRRQDWAMVDNATICHIIDSLPPGLTERKIYRRDDLKEPNPLNEPGYYQIMRRILTAEHIFYTGPLAGHILEQMGEPGGPFKYYLKQSNISITNLLHFTRAVSHKAQKPKLSPTEKKTPSQSSSSKPPSIDPPPNNSIIHPQFQYNNINRQSYFFEDMSRVLRKKPDNHTQLEHRTFLLPDSRSPHEYIDKGILKINSHTLLFDTTLNNTLLKLIQELDVRPGIIVKEFSFWPDGADSNLPETPSRWTDFYSVQHWLSDNYTIYPFALPSPNPPSGSGFVACMPKIYVLKKKTSSLGVSKLIGRARSLSRGASPSPGQPSS